MQQEVFGVFPKSYFADFDEDRPLGVIRADMPNNVNFDTSYIQEVSLQVITRTSALRIH